MRRWLSQCPARQFAAVVASSTWLLIFAGSALIGQVTGLHHRAGAVLIFTSVFAAWNTGLVTWARQRRSSADRSGKPGPMLPYVGLEHPAGSADR
ncbi:MAG: hypothetical protein ACYCVZ_19795 [Streptosporangiaceae bacterium]